MQPGVRSHRLTSSDLTRLLADLCLSGELEPAQPAQSFGERLGQWLNWTDAIALSSALGSAAAAAALAPPGRQPRQVRELARELALARTALTQAITRDGTRVAQEHPEATTDFTPLRQHVQAQQRAMDKALPPLRAQLRAQLERSGAAGSRLAALDAVLDNALAAKERAVLAQVPALLEERHTRLRHTQAGSAQEEETSTDWLAGLHKDIQAVLLAELDLRLQPLLGLLEALQHDVAADPQSLPQDKTQEKNRTR